MTLERSPEVQESIDTARQAEPADKRELAENLRGEILLKNAALAIKIITTLVQNPSIDPEVIRERIQNTGDVAHPQIVENFLNAVDLKQRLVDRVLGLARTEQKPEDTLASTIFKGFLEPSKEIDLDRPEQYIPKGKIEMDTTYPLALVMYLESSEDMKVLGLSEGGHRVFSMFYKDGKFVDGCPTIFVKVDKDPSVTAKTERHEKKHAELDAFKKALLTLDDDFVDDPVSRGKAVWGDPEYRYKLQEYGKELQGMLNNGMLAEEVAETPTFKKVLGTALSFAKDEFIAFTYEGTPYTDIVLSLTLSGGVYDLFAKAAPIESDLYKQLKLSFMYNLSPNLRVAQFYLDAYNNSVLIDRRESFLWVLSQIPIAQWSEQLEHLPFKRELENIYDVMRSYDMLQKGVTDSEIEASSKKFFDSLHHNCFDHLLFDDVVQAKTELTKFR